jgi:hypothetical protein
MKKSMEQLTLLLSTREVRSRKKRFQDFRTIGKFKLENLKGRNHFENSGFK